MSVARARSDGGRHNHDSRSQGEARSHTLSMATKTSTIGGCASTPCTEPCPRTSTPWPTMSGAGVYWRWESRAGSDGCPSGDCDGVDVRYARGVRTIETWRADTVVILLDGGAVAAWLRNNVRGEGECQGGRMRLQAARHPSDGGAYW